MSIAIAALILLAIIQMGLALAVVLAASHSQRLQNARTVFGSLSVVISFWTVINASLLLVDQDSSHAYLDLYNTVNRAGYFLGAWVITGMYLFTLYFPVRHKISRWGKAILTLGAVTTIGALTPAVAGQFVIKEGAVIYEPGPLTVLVGLYAVTALVNIFLRLRHFIHHGTDKRAISQARTLRTGLSLMLVHGVFFIILLPVIFGDNLALYAFGYGAPFFFAFAATFSITRQGLFDIRPLVARTVAYALLLLSLLLGYLFIATALAGAVLGDTTTTNERVLNFSTALLFAVIYQPLKRFYDRLTNRIFYRDAYDSQQVLNELGVAIATEADLNRLITSSLTLLGGALRPTTSGFYLLSDNRPVLRTLNGQVPLIGGELLEQQQPTLLLVSEMDERNELHKTLDKQELALSLRLASKDKAIGYLLLGFKQSGSGYTKQDKNLLMIVAHELAVALENAQQFAEIQKFNVTLRQRIEDATGELRRTNEKLKALDEAKDEFISMASHQLRTPLTSVKGYVSMVMEGDAGKITPKQTELLDSAFNSAQRMVYLIADLLNVSRLKTGKFVIEPAEVDLPNLIQGEVDQVKETAKSRKVELIYKPPKKFPKVWVDDNKTRQVIMNFIDNAIYYTPAGGKIEIKLTETPKAIEFRVVDNGIGVPKSERHKLFAKFYRADNARSARPDGTGLGLFMAKKVVVAQGGSIIFESIEGKGSIFGFSFPSATITKHP